MCLRFDTCFSCFGVHDHDEGAPRRPGPAKTTTPPPARANGNSVHSGNGHYPTVAAGDEAGSKASNDARRAPAHAAGAGAATARDARGYTSSQDAQEEAHLYSGVHETLKHHPPPASDHNNAGDVAGHGAHYYYYERQPAQKEDAPGHHYPATANSIANHGRY